MKYNERTEFAIEHNESFEHMYGMSMDRKITNFWMGLM